MFSGRAVRMKYPLRELPRQDCHRQLKGPPISRRALTTTVEEATQGETNTTNGLDHLAALVAQLTQRQEDDRREREQREQARERRAEERQRREEECL